MYFVGLPNFFLKKAHGQAISHVALWDFGLAYVG
jgi:hypothetical protein